LKTFLLRVISLLRFDFETGEKIKKNGEGRGEGMKETKHKIARRCMYSSKDGKRHDMTDDRHVGYEKSIGLWNSTAKKKKKEKNMSLPIYPLSLSLFFSLLFCTCVMGATT
jgi:hypothetical protein